MRVLHILDRSPPCADAYSLRAASILRAQRKLGWETFQLTGPYHPGVDQPEEEIDDLVYLRTPRVRGLLAGIPLMQDWEASGELTFRVEQLVRSLRPHILHAHAPSRNALATLRVGRRVGLPVVYQTHADAPAVGGPAWLKWRNLRQLLRHIDALATASMAEHDTLVRESGLRAEQVSWIPTGLDPALIGAAPSRQALGVDADVLLVAAHAVGMAPEFSGLAHRELTMRPGIRVVWLDAKMPDSGLDLADLSRVAQFAAAADIALFFADRPIDQHARLLAMGRGQVVIAARGAGTESDVTHGTTGLLFDPGQPSAASKLLARVVEHADERSRIAQAAARYVAEQRNWVACAASYRPLYSRLAETAV